MPASEQGLFLDSSLTGGSSLDSVKWYVNLVPLCIFREPHLSSTASPDTRDLSPHTGKEPCLEAMRRTPRFGEQSENQYREFYLKVRNSVHFPILFFLDQSSYEQVLRKRLLYITYKKHQDFLVQEIKRQTKNSSTILYNINSWRTVIQEKVSNINSKLRLLPATRT